MNTQTDTLAKGVALCLTCLTFAAQGNDWAMLGRDATRNAVSPEKNPPVDWVVGDFDRKAGKWIGSRNVKWTARLGTLTFGDPVVADGLVWVGTNNAGHEGFEGKDDASVLMCFRETDGKLVFQYVSPRLPQGREFDWEFSSFACSPLIEGDRIWFTTNRGETVCLDIGPLKRGEGEPNVVWQMDMIKQLGVHRRGADMGLAHTCSPAAYRDFIHVITGNGVRRSGPEVPAPDAPSLVCLNKVNGKVVWQDSSPGKNILHGQWASPLVIETNGRAQVIVPQGDGWLRSFDALSGKLIWKFDMNRKDAEWLGQGRGTRNNILATPVFHNGLIYIGSGRHPLFLQGPGRLCCIDPTKRGDISSELAVDTDSEVIPHRRTQAVDPEQGERAIANPNSGLVWEYFEKDENKNGKIEFEEQFHRTVSSVAIKDGLLIAADSEGLINCFDAKCGKRYWYYDTFALCAAPLIVDDKVYVANEDGDVAIFNLSADPKKAMKEISGVLEPIEVINMSSSVYTSPIFASGTLYVATRSTLFVIQAGKQGSGRARSETQLVAQARFLAAVARSESRQHFDGHRTVEGMAQGKAAIIVEGRGTRRWFPVSCGCRRRRISGRLSG